MIRFGLTCNKDHAFEAWFRSGDDFDKQNSLNLVTCPHCGSHEVNKALMAPAVATKSNNKPRSVALALSDEQKNALEQLKAITRQVRENSEYVGDRFAEEARKIHFGETETRGIYGEATTEEAKALVDEGVEFVPLPILPEDAN